MAGTSRDSTHTSRGQAMTANKPMHLVPKLRFPEFQDDPPWSAPLLEDLYDFKRTNTLSRDELNYVTGTIRNIHYGDIHTKFKPLFQVCEEHVPYVNSSSSSKGIDDDAFCEEGDIVLADASEDLNDVGKAIEVVSLQGQRVVAGTHTILGTRRGNVPVVGFGGQLFQSAAVRAGIKKEAQGAKVYGISAKRISTVPIPIPPTVAEQQKIADCLGSLDDLIAVKERKVEALRQHKQGLMQQLFPQPGETRPRLRFPKFQDAPDWKTGRCSDIARVLPGFGFPDKFQGNKKGQFPFYKVSDISRAIEEGNKYISKARNYIESDVLDVIRGKPVPTGTIIFAKIGEAIRSNRRVVITKPAVIDNNTAGVKAKKAKSSDEFLFYIWSNVSLIDHAGGVVPAVSKSALEDVPLCYPSDPDEQQRIANCLNSLDELIAAEGRRLLALRQHKQGLIQQLFPEVESH